MSELADKLEASIEAVRLRGRIVPKEELPTEADLIAVHAMLSRVCRSSRTGFFVAYPLEHEAK